MSCPYLRTHFFLCCEQLLNRKHHPASCPTPRCELASLSQISLLTGIVIATGVPGEVVMAMIIMKHHYGNRNLWKVFFLKKKRKERKEKKENRLSIGIGIKEGYQGGKGGAVMNTRLEQGPEQR